jgi:hypothetical protein
MSTAGAVPQCDVISGDCSVWQFGQTQSESASRSGARFSSTSCWSVEFGSIGSVKHENCSRFVTICWQASLLKFDTLSEVCKQRIGSMIRIGNTTEPTIERIQKEQQKFVGIVLVPVRE